MKAKKSNTETRRHRVLFYVTLYEGLRFPAARCRKFSQACNFPLHAAGSFRRLAISRCTLQEAFAGLRFLAARCRKLSQACDFSLHVAGSFRRLAIPCCTLQEAFVGLRFPAARCRKLSQACDFSLHAAGGFRRSPIPCCMLQEVFARCDFLPTSVPHFSFQSVSIPPAAARHGHGG